MTWTTNKKERIARHQKRLDQLNEWIDNKYKPENEEEPPRLDLTAIKLETEILRKIAEEQGDIPKTQQNTNTDNQLQIEINGTNTQQL